jgi:hypothetical protein
MKKLLTVAVLSLGLLAMAGGRASAGFLFHKCCGHCTTICCKPYNAFSPTCSGTICCDGCCPINFNNAPAPAPAPCYPDCGPVCADGACSAPLLPSGPAPTHVPPASAPAGGGGELKAPTPAPSGTPMSQAYPYGYAPVHRVGYHPAYAGYGYPQRQGQGYNAGYGYPQANVPSPYPYGSAPMQNYGAATPAYWYGGR